MYLRTNQQARERRYQRLGQASLLTWTGKGSYM